MAERPAALFLRILAPGALARFPLREVSFVWTASAALLSAARRS